MQCLMLWRRFGRALLIPRPRFCKAGNSAVSPFFSASLSATAAATCDASKHVSKRQSVMYSSCSWLCRLQSAAQHDRYIRKAHVKKPRNCILWVYLGCEGGGCAHSKSSLKDNLPLDLRLPRPSGLGAVHGFCWQLQVSRAGRECLSGKDRPAELLPFPAGAALPASEMMQWATWPLGLFLLPQLWT